MHESAISRWSHREFLTRLTWLDDQWNRPSRSDHYLMQIAQRVEDVLRTEPVKRKDDYFVIPFVKKAPPKPLTREQAAALSKARWKMMLGMR